MARQLVKRRTNALLHSVFDRIRTHPAYRRLERFPLWARLLLGIPLFLFGVLAWLTPIPGGTVILLLSGVVLFSFGAFRSWCFYLLQRSRVVYWYGKWRERGRAGIPQRLK